MQRKVLIAGIVSAASLGASGAAALAIASGGGGSAAPARPAGNPTVVVERLYEDTFVVLGTPTTVAPTAQKGPVRTVSTGAAPAASTGAPPAAQTVAAAAVAGPSPTAAPATTAGRSTTPTTTARPAAPATTARPPSTTSTISAPPRPTTTRSGNVQTRTYSSSGGSFTLQWTSRSMQVVATAPAAGYTARVEGSGTEIAILFASPDRDIEITVKLVSGSPRVTGL